jgi:glycine/D-amino acid oxidase-like deaminating enzyme
LLLVSPLEGTDPDPPYEPQKLTEAVITLGGHLKPDNYHAIARLAAEYGHKAAEEIAVFESSNVKAVAEYILENKVDCDFIASRAVDVQLSYDVHRKVGSNHRAMIQAGSIAVQETFAVPDIYAERVSGMYGAKSAYSYPAAQCWPYKLVHHMFSNAIRKGVNLQTETVVTQLADKPASDGFWTVQTARGTIRARKVVVATNAYSAAILPEYRDKIMPYKGICCRIECPPGKAPLLSNTYGIRFSDWNFDYLVQRPDGSIIVGGARVKYFQDLESWYGDCDDSTLIENAKGYFDGYMQRHFHGWKDSGAHVTHIWTGSK